MIVKRLLAAAMMIALGISLGACSTFSGFVADHWPHWAGGMPDDVPPRPGAPGYAEFISHGGVDKDAAQSASPGQKPAAPDQTAASSEPKAPGQAPTQPDRPADGGANDGSVLHGGLY
ncbi:MAG TPA: hypothetical protein VGJ20_24080 [Xanthobacteraceae bacterium]|jgi:hypothetical protein